MAVRQLSPYTLKETSLVPAVKWDGFRLEILKVKMSLLLCDSMLVDDIFQFFFS